MATVKTPRLPEPSTPDCVVTREGSRFSCALHVEYSISVDLLAPTRSASAWRKG